MPKTREPLPKRLLGFRYLFLLNGAVFLLFSFAFGREYVRNHEIQRDIDALQVQAEQLAARNLQITELSTALRTESFIEREARLKLGLKKPGEEVVVIRREKPGQAGSGPAVAGESDPLELVRKEYDPADIANPTKWWYYFFDTNRYRRIAAYGNEHGSD